MKSFSSPRALIVAVLAIGMIGASVTQAFATHHEDNDDGKLIQGHFSTASAAYMTESVSRNPHFHSAIFTGSCRKGDIRLELADPPALCITTDCGHNAQNSLFKIKVRNNVVSLDNVITNPNNAPVQPYGVTNNVSIHSISCKGNEAVFGLQFNLFITNTSNPARVELVDTFNRASYRLKINKGHHQEPYTTGESYGFSVPWSSLVAASGSSNPYQFLATESDIDSRFPMQRFTTPPYVDGLYTKNLLRAHRIVSPYGTATRPFSSPAPLFFTGSFDSTSIEKNGVIAGLASIRTGAQAAFTGNGTLPGLGNLILENVPFVGHSLPVASNKVGLITYGFMNISHVKPGMLAFIQDTLIYSDDL